MYPAGFVYVYTILYYVTSFGTNLKLAQYIFLSIYIFQMYFSFRIYRFTQKVPPYALILCTLTSYRIHSIYVLRLFNDPIAVLLFYISLNLFLANSWILGSVFFSLAVSIKMNILLYAPCLLVAYLTNLSVQQTLFNLAICAFVQLFLGLPFLYGNFWSYLMGSFDLGRVFEHKWTVNYRFLDRSIFESQYFHFTLLLLHLILLIIFFPKIKKFLTSYAKLNKVIVDFKNNKKGRNDNIKLKEKDSVSFSKVSQLFVLPFFVTNLIGVSCARSLHYQFYSWYFHSLLYLVYCTPYRKPVMFLLLALIELCWNIYPSTSLSSVLLHACHFVILYGVYNVMKR